MCIRDSFMTVADELDDIYDKLVKNRTAQAKAMGCLLYTSRCV